MWVSESGVRWQADARGDEVHFAHRLVPLLDVLHREHCIRKSAEPRIGKLRVGIASDGIRKWRHFQQRTGSEQCPASAMRRSLK
jgi:hypothetical protein